MSWLADYDAGNNPHQDVLDTAFKELCQQVLNYQDDTLKHWFELAFEAGKTQEDVTFEEWWSSFYSALEQGAEKD